MPQLITNYERKAAEVQIKKDYSTLANALQMAENEYGRLEDWTIDNPDKADDEYLQNIFSWHMNLVMTEINAIMKKLALILTVFILD